MEADSTPGDDQSAADSGEATAAPEATPDQTPTAEASETAAPSAQADTVPATEADVGHGPAWIAEGAHRRYGDLEELLPIAMGNGATIMLCTTEVLALSGYSIEDVRAVSFGVDKEALGDYADGRSVRISSEAPNGSRALRVVYIWAGLSGGSSSAGGAEGSESSEVDSMPAVNMLVRAEGFSSDGPSKPSFTLTAYPALSEGMTFAVSVNGGAAQAIGSDRYTPAASGSYYFAILDATGAEAARSITYQLEYGEPVNTQEPANGEDSEQPAIDGDTTDAPQDELLTQEDVAQTVTPEQAYEEIAAPEITVRAYDYAEGIESSLTPSFSLSGAPVGSGYSYGLSLNGAAMKRLAGDTYTAVDSGEYTLQFYLLAEDGSIVDQSAVYHVILNFTEAAQTGDAWMMLDGKRVYGSLSSLLRHAQGGQTIYILTGAVLSVTNTAKLAAVNLAPDPEHYGSEFGVVTSATSPDGAKSDGVMYVWIGVDVDDASTKDLDLPTATSFTVDRVTIGSRTLANNLWVNGKDALRFIITDTVTTNTYAYEISVDGGVTFQTFGEGRTLGSLSPSLISGSSYNVVFRVTATTDPLNTYTTGVYALKYDSVSPTLLCRAGADGTLTFYAGDSISGFSGTGGNVTFNATADPISWVAQLTYQGDGVYTYAVRYDTAGVIAAGTLAVRDSANNVTVWNEDITIDPNQGGQGGGGAGAGGGGGGRFSAGGQTYRVVYHSASTYDAVIAYGGVAMTIGDGAMEVLTMGDETLPLMLAQAGAGGASAFWASLAAWGDAQGTSVELSNEDDVSWDTLVLTAAQAQSSQGTYTWTFDGTLPRTLLASGLNHMVFTVGEQAVTLPTAGFIGGVRYAMYRSAGLVSKDFQYTLQMDASGAFSLWVTVQGETFSLTDDVNSDFYYFDVDSGTLTTLESTSDEATASAASTSRLG